jgi:membrane-bound lytic murein transglycosylase MltF
MSSARFSLLAPWRVAGAMVVLLAAAGSARADLAQVRKAGTLRVSAVDGAPAFFSFKADGAPGLEREILEGFCRLQRLNCRMQSAASPLAGLNALGRGEADVTAGALLSDETLKEIEFSAEVLPSRLVIVNRRPAPPVGKVGELDGTKLGACMRAASNEAIVNAANLGGLSFEDSHTPFGVLSALKSGRLGAAILGVEYAMPARESDPDLQIGTAVGEKMSLAFGLRKSDAQLRSVLNEYIGNLRRTATWNRLILKYFGDSASDILKATR